MTITKEILNQAIIEKGKNLEKRPDEPFRTFNWHRFSEGQREIFANLTQLVGFAAPPQVAHSSTFDKQKTILIYRGTTSANHNVDFLTGENYFRGEGIFGSGIYSTTNLREAIQYTTDPVESVSANPERVLTFKLDENAKFINNEDLFELDELALKLIGDGRDDPKVHREFKKYIRKFEKNPAFKEQAKNAQTFYEFCSSIPNADRRIARFILGTEPPLIAVILGFDGLEIDNASATHYVIYNRSKVIVNEREFERITSGGEPDRN